eukprot:TRINITY_DN6482_c0_g1_i1.p1 TRINITY_DN6482_c0_g1~~TRINITY_DN6482_c0_g1_i1.p1  ORF type:complete len:232 (-),score=30.63 TRINITY_DN6482_c0_g1_i1:75-770(-)
MEGMINILKTQLKQSASESQMFEQLYKQNAENWKNEKLIKGEEDLNGEAILNVNNNGVADYYTSSLLESTKALLDSQLNKLKGEEKINDETLLQISQVTTDFFQEISSICKANEREYNKIRELSSEINAQLDIERQNEDLLIETVANLQQQILAFTPRQTTTKFSISVLDLDEKKVELGSIRDLSVSDNLPAVTTSTTISSPPRQSSFNPENSYHYGGVPTSVNVDIGFEK